MGLGRGRNVVTCVNVAISMLTQGHDSACYMGKTFGETVMLNGRYVERPCEIFYPSFALKMDDGGLSKALRLDKSRASAQVACSCSCSTLPPDWTTFFDLPNSFEIRLYLEIASAVYLNSYTKIQPFLCMPMKA